ncbi:hypothetical protein NIES2109_56370 (plasmid) [Nostoc sp. HK-01]|nr:hypothetical protein NIES2109_56370 [Nostoc sp. HK-01]
MYNEYNDLSFEEELLLSEAEIRHRQNSAVLVSECSTFTARIRTER